jgi:hypothetical protein
MAMQGARAGDLFRLQLARSLAPQGNPTTPLAALGNLGRLAASLYMQQNVAKGIEDRRTAADRAALAALQGTRQPIYATRPTVGDVDLSPPSPGIPTAQIGERRVGPDRAGLISILSNPNVSENISKLAGTLLTEQISADQAAADRDFRKGMQETSLSAAASENRANRNSRERLSRLRNEFEADQSAQAIKAKKEIAQLNRDLRLLIAQNTDARQIAEARIRASNPPGLIKLAQFKYPGDIKAQREFVEAATMVTDAGVYKPYVYNSFPGEAPTGAAPTGEAPTGAASEVPPEQTDAASATGVVDFPVRVAESLGDKFFGTDAIRARRAENVEALIADTLGRQVVGRDGRPSNWSDQRILEVLPKTGFFVSDAQYQNRVKFLMERLDRKITELDGLARDGTVSAAIRSQANRDAQSLALLRDDWGETIGATSDVALPDIDPDVKAKADKVLRQYEQKANQ